MNLRLRALSAAVLLPLTLGAAWLGGSWFFAFLALAAILAAREFYSLAVQCGGRPLVLAGTVGAVLFIVRADLPEPSLASFLLILLVALALLRHLQAGTSILGGRSASPQTSVWGACRRSVLDWGWTLLGMGYCGWLLSRLAALRQESQGWEWVWLAMLTTFALDTVAYAVGRLAGRHRMAPRVSPGKTWEGAVGGLAGAVLAAVGLGAVLGLEVASVHLVVLGLLVGVAGQAGDLAESWLKRQAGAKDSGALIPGHGGVLDRLDSLLFVSFVVFYYQAWVIR